MEIIMELPLDVLFLGYIFGAMFAYLLYILMTNKVD
jgi:hypothetical protein